MTRHIRTFIAVVCLLLVSQALWSDGVAGAESRTPEPQSQIDALQKQLEELRREYSERLSEIERKIEELGSLSQADEEASIRRSAEEMADSVDEDEATDSGSQDTVFRSGALGLQALNPEISVVGDSITWFGNTEGEERRSDFGMRVLGVHFESYLDPYSRLKATVPVTKDWTRLGEAYLTRYDIGKNLNVTIGKFNQQFGVVNRWHAPSLDQVESPLALRQILAGNLNQTGVSFDWGLSGTASRSQSVTLQFTNGENPRVFGQNSKNVPSALLRYANYHDLSKDKYLEMGLTTMVGWNNRWFVNQSGYGTVTDNRSLSTWLLGADLTLLWEPTEAMRYKNWLWRSEAYCLHKNILAPDGSGKDALNAWGAYSYFQRKVSRTTEVGARLDYYRPDVKGYADISGLSLSPLAVTTSGARQWQISPYLTWWQSPWVKWRLEYDHRWGRGLPGDDRLMLQCTFAAGPHKHERY